MQNATRHGSVGMKNAKRLARVSTEKDAEHAGYFITFYIQQNDMKRGFAWGKLFLRTGAPGNIKLMIRYDTAEEIGGFNGAQDSSGIPSNKT